MAFKVMDFLKILGYGKVKNSLKQAWQSGGPDSVAVIGKGSVPRVSTWPAA